ncbi:MAG: hypothetical protein DHS20C13_11150 [Thermodesulfobacteriota bacterium]|nr:MAG: hypothetical protein DHS20C13_11150 [Thermodesulfobacteriota bacterium]
MTYYKSHWNVRLSIISITVLFFSLVLSYPITAFGDSSITKNGYFSENFQHLSQNNEDINSTIDTLYAQVVEEEIYTDSNSLNPDPDYKTGYYGTKDWQSFVAIYLWFVGMNGETGEGRAVADVDMSFGDIWDNLDVGVQAHFEFWWKKWIFFLDPIFMKLSSNNSQTRVISSLKSKLEVKMFLMDLAMGYRVAELALGSSTKSNNFKSWPSVSIDVYGGGRILSVDNTINLTIETPLGTNKQRIKIDEAWFDFIVGTRFIFDFTENVLLSIKSDIGGFGLGFSSDIDWNFVANVGYQLPWWGVTPYIGYRVLYIDYADGSGDNRFVYKMWQTGPQIGLGVRF